MSLKGKTLNNAAQILAYKDVYAVGSRVGFGYGDASRYAMDDDGNVILSAMSPAQVSALLTPHGLNGCDLSVIDSEYGSMITGTSNSTVRAYDRSQNFLFSASHVNLHANLKSSGAVSAYSKTIHDISLINGKISNGVGIQTGSGNVPVFFSEATWNSENGVFENSYTRIGSPSDQTHTSEILYNQDAANSHFLGAEGKIYNNKRCDLGDANHLFDTVYAVNNVINTSDERLKNIIDIPQSWIDAAKLIKPVAFQWLDEIEQFNAGNKKQAPRYHIGYSAQAVFNALISAGEENPWRCAFLCKDVLTEKDEAGEIVPLLDENGEQIERWGIRQVELNTLKLS